MCLATGYRETEAKESICMTNIQEVVCDGAYVILTDIFGQELAIQGHLCYANFDKGKVIVHETYE